ncbi:thioesterase II family protein [Streptomyces sp. NPDC059913]|uniref:thioesterase II family protein n=1 Tax=unclassified Streptomyces TaxID=2593676 RepID=UPI00365B403E
MTSAPRPRLVRPRPVPAPAVRIFLFHHAGGSHLFYRDWVPLFPDDWEVVLVEAPSRVLSSRQPQCADLAVLVGLFREELRPWLERPYVFFGHSMGALAATEVTRLLHDEGESGPLWIGLSAWTTVPVHARPGAGRHLLPDDELRALLAGVGGTPSEVLNNERLWRFCSPAIRHDFRLIDTRGPALGTTAADVPQSLFGGEQDTLLPSTELVALAARLPRLTGLHLYPGDHFYLRPHSRDVVRRITADVGSVRSAGTEH